MIKKLLITLMLVLPGLGLVQAQNMNYEDIDPSGQTVVYWHQYSDDSSQADTMAALVEEFNSMNEYGITVETIHQGSYSPIQDLMNTAILSGEMPNLVAGYANAIAGWANEGVRGRYQLAAQQPAVGYPGRRAEQAQLRLAGC